MTHIFFLGTLEQALSFHDPFQGQDDIQSQLSCTECYANGVCCTHFLPTSAPEVNLS